MLLNDALERICMEQADLIEKQSALIAELSTTVSQLAAVVDSEAPDAEIKEGT